MDEGLHILLVSFNTRQKTETSVQCLLRHTDLPFHLWIADNASVDGSTDMLASYAKRHPDRITLLALPQNIGYSRAIGRLYPLLPGQGDVCYINSDVYVGPSWATQLRQHLYTCLGAAAVGPIGRGIGGWQDVGQYLPGACPGHYEESVVTSMTQSLQDGVPKAITAKCLQGTIWMVKRNALQDIGGLDEGCLCGADDADWSLRARIRGWRLLVALDTFVWHDDHSSYAYLDDQGASWIEQSWDYFNRKWAGQFDHLSWSELMETKTPLSFPFYEYEAY